MDNNSPWEALDVDDSDLPSLLRPCKRRLPQTTVNSPPILTPSSSPCPSPTQALASSHSQHPNSSPPPTFRLIPGPAGAIQAAMLRKAHEHRDLPPDESPVPTQEYIRRAVEDAEEDDDFRHNPWLSAVDFLIADGWMDGLIPSTPLNAVMECLNMGKVGKVVAVIKSCTPNGFGDFMVTLKDPTGTMGASIHGKILTESSFAKDISVGSVLILQKVSVFSPTRSAHYLNITLTNIVKVFSKDADPQIRQNYPPPTVKYASPATEYAEKAMLLEKSISREPRRTEGIMNEMMRQNVSGRINNRKEKGTPTSGKGNQYVALGKENLLGRQGTVKEAVRLDENQSALDKNYKWPTGGSIECTTSVEANMVENTSGKEAEGIEKQREPLILRASLPEWTDEQLNELFDRDCEDGGSLF
ncbi:hypothetical protein LguiA_009263 [Lonicera macranthoides]